MAAIGNDVGSDEAQIRAFIDDWAKALRAKDLDGIMSHYASDIVCFDVAPPLQCIGAAALRKNLQDWFATFKGPIGYEIADLDITAGDHAAFARSLNRLSGIRSDGERTDVWLRMTLCWHKTQGKWMIVHERASRARNTATALDHRGRSSVSGGRSPAEGPDGGDA
jgi:ketosteroid isomerase-like protein